VAVRRLCRSGPTLRLAEMYWDPAQETLRAWASVARAFILRKPASTEDVRSEELVNQGGAWVLQFDDFTDPDERPMPFAAILDVLPSVVIVPSLMPYDERSKELREYVWGNAKDAGFRIEMNNQALMDLGAWSRAASPGRWYAGLRERWMATRVRLLIVTAGVPDPRGPAHHFYVDPITSGDGLFRTIVEAVYGESPGRAGAPKSPWLEKLGADGVCALEIVREPTLLRHEFEEAILAGVGSFMDDALRLDPLGVVICGERPFLALLHAGLPLLHRHPIPSPTSSKGMRQLADVIRRGFATPR
jgi:hypothetical protein